MSAIRARARRDRPREAAEVRRRLPRPRRRAAGRGRLRPRHARASPSSPGVPEAATAARPSSCRGTTPRPSAPRSPSTSSPRCCASPTRPTWASSRRPPASSSCCASCATEHGALLVFDEVITGFRVAHGGAQELTGVLPDLTVMGKVIGGGLPAAAYGGSTELMELDRAGRRRLPGRHAEREPARGRRRAARRCELLDEEAYLRCRTSRSQLADGPARGRRRRGRCRSRTRTGPADRLLLRGARARLRGRRGLRPRGLRRLVPGAAGARRLPAAVAVRGLVPVARPHARARDAHARGRRRGVRGDRMSALDASARTLRARGRPARATGGRPATHGAARRAAPPARARRRRARYALLVEAIREGYLLHYGEGRVRAHRRPATSRCWRATGCTRWGSRGWPSSATSRRSPSSPTSSRVCAQAHAEGTRTARPRWEAGVGGVGDGPRRPSRPPMRAVAQPPSCRLRSRARPPARYCSAVRPRSERPLVPDPPQDAQVQVHRRPPDRRAPSRARPSRGAAS